MNFEGVIVVDKPAGWTSHDVVNKMRGIAGTRRVGHLGTLDPLATGVLPVMIGQATRLARFWENSEKAYEAVVRFGFATDTWDREGEKTDPSGEPLLTEEILEACLAPMRGAIEQTPPPVSAKKINGVPAYKLARQKIAVDLAPVRVEIRELTLRGIDGDRIRLGVRCSPGTYVRAIAHELGITLGCGAHIDELVRTASGPFRLEDAHTLEHLQELKDAGRLEETLLRPADLLLNLPAVFLDDVGVTQIRQGRDFTVSAFRVQPGTEHVRAIGPDGNLVAIGRAALPHTYHPVVVLNA
ncbi:MAG: tRNA pseudouridine(55) synthase TruB [Terriglobia bacterium]